MTEAEQAILARIKEFFVVTMDHIEEAQILDDAVHAFRALMSCVVMQAKRSLTQSSKVRAG
jgi:hypothetical protein